MPYTSEQKRVHRILCTNSDCWCKHRGRGGRKRYKRKPWPGPAVFIDGEAYEDGSYALLQTYDPRDGTIYTTRAAEGRLSSSQCLQHLYLHPKAPIFGFGLKYDISNWLMDVNSATLLVLRSIGHAKWGSTWKIDHIPGKSFKVCDFTREDGDKQRQVWDLHPFFQQSFIAALEAANLNVPDIIRLGKRLRGRFSRSNSEFVERYNEAELLAMAGLHLSLCDTLAAGDAKIRHWFGPGSIARHKAKEQGVTVGSDQLTSFLAARKDLSTAGMEPVEALQAREQSPHACVVDAFFGGRFELSQQGPVDACWEYDLSSAYPWALSQGMPCFACGGEWRQCEWRDPHHRWSVWRAHWTPNRSTSRVMWGVLPVRMTRNLAWPREGLGWYHREEVLAAEQYFRDEYHITVGQGWSWHPACDHDPWSWVSAAAAERVAIKHTDPARAQCLKLALNSLYGITADKAGVDNGRVPRYHNPYWAGLITARTRARLLHAAAVGGEDIVYLATDGVHSKRHLDLPIGTALGDWEPPKRSGIPAVFLAPGTYLYADSSRGKSRGINLGKFSDRIETWQRLYRMTAPHGQINLRERHFCPFPEALSRAGGQDNDHYHEILNTWADRKRALSYDLAPRREKRPDGRWIAPGLSDWRLLAQLSLIRSDDQMRREEEYAGYQPEWSEHPLLCAARDNN